MRKNDIEFRPTMGVHLLESCLVTKIDNITKDTPCFKKEFTSKFIKKAKSCTYKDLKGSRQGPDDNDIHLHSIDNFRILILALCCNNHGANWSDVFFFERY